MGGLIGLQPLDLDHSGIPPLYINEMEGITLTTPRTEGASLPTYVFVRIVKGEGTTHLLAHVTRSIPNKLLHEALRM